MENNTLLAAVDLGSNSFRLEIDRYEHGQIHRVDYLKETVRLGNGLDSERNLTEEVMQRGWDCLARFRERLAGFTKAQVRVVATQTLREARNRDVFIKQGNAILGFPIEVIGGIEEARLIYQGVSHLLPQSQEQRLVIDIGGRSTELILGQDMVAKETNSFKLGSVTWSMKYFPEGRFTESAFEHADIAAQAVLEEALILYPRNQWEVAYGASGTVGAVAEILKLAGWPEGFITMEGMRWLRKSLLRAGHAQNLNLKGLKEDRRPVIGGGVAILYALMSMLNIEEMQVAQGALRQGVLLEMIERSDQHRDIRNASVERLSHKFGIDVLQAQRVERTALWFLGNIVPDSEHNTDHMHRELRWASQLHEVGMAISHTDYHKHGAYIVNNADILGFSMTELYRLSTMILCQKGKLRKQEQELEDTILAQALLSMRLAIVLCHARQDPDVNGLQLRYQEDGQVFTVLASQNWCQAHPLSAHLLQQEANAWERTAWKFVFVTE